MKIFAACCKLSLCFFLFLSLSAVPGAFGNEPTDPFSHVTLDADLSHLSSQEKRMVPHLVAAARAMEAVFWHEAYGDRNTLMDAHKGDSKILNLFEIHFGPWDRYNDNAPFVQSFGPKPPGAGFYPKDSTKSDIERAAIADPSILGPYSLVRKNSKGDLYATPYHKAFAKEHAEAAHHLFEAAKLAENPTFATYLRARAASLLNDDYQSSDMAWMDLQGSNLDVIIGPIEGYEDQLMGVKTAHEAFVLVRDQKGSEQLRQYERLLPDWQKALPVPPDYKKETPGTRSDIGTYNVLLYAGDASVTRPIAVNLPNDPQVQKTKGSRRLQFKNAIQAKYDKILVPMADALLENAQRSRVSFDSFFENTLMHELAHGLGIHTTLIGGESVESTLKESAWMLEEAKADTIGLFLVLHQHQQGMLSRETLHDHFTTAFASMFRAIRFGPSSSHARANLIQFNYLMEKGAIERLENDRYRLDLGIAPKAITDLVGIILRIQGDGDLEGLLHLEARYGPMDPGLKSDLEKVNRTGIPLDVVFHPAKNL